jgi:hypothetical protein
LKSFQLRMRGISSNPNRWARANTGNDWALRVGVHRGRLEPGLLLEQPVDDVDGLPHPAGDEPGEQGDVGVGDVVVRDPARPAVANRGLGEEVIDERVDLRAVGGHAGPVTPGADQVQLAERVDDVGDGAVQLADGDVAAGGGPQLVGGDPGDVPGGLRRAEIAAVGERGQHVAEERAGQFGV